MDYNHYRLHSSSEYIVLASFAAALTLSYKRVHNSGAGRRLLWLSCGDSDNLMNVSKSFHQYLTDVNVEHVWHIDSGGHTWPVWKNDLHLISQRLFQDEK